MKKKRTGLLFFNELSREIVDDLVAQHIAQLSPKRVRDLIHSLEPEVSTVLL